MDVVDDSFDLEYENVSNLLASICSEKPTPEQSAQWMMLVRGCNEKIRGCVANAIAESYAYHG
eukprot:3858806-Amphidinium_carterae.1